MNRLIDDVMQTATWNISEMTKNGVVFAWRSATAARRRGTGCGYMLGFIDFVSLNPNFLRRPLHGGGVMRCRLGPCVFVLIIG